MTENRSSRRMLAVGLPGVLLLIGLLGWGLRSPTQLGPNPMVGHPLPRFTLPTLDGAAIASSDLAGRVAVVNVWASWCVPCREEAATLRAAWSHERGTATFIGVSFEDDADAARAFAARYGMSWTLATDPGSRLAIALGVTGVPETFVVAPDGRISWVSIGPVDAVSLKTAIDQAGATS